MQSKTSTLPDGKPLILPSLRQPLPKSPNLRDDDNSNSDDPPVAYALKLTKAMAESLIAAGEAGDATLELITSNSGFLRIPGTEPYSFTTQSIPGAQLDTSRAVCYSRRNDGIRQVGQVVADLELDIKISQQGSATAKKRTLEASKSTNSNKMEVINDFHLPNKRPRVRSKTTVEKRPRTSAPRRATPASTATILTSPAPLSTHPAPSFSTKLGSSVTDSPAPNGSTGSTTNGTSHRRKQESTSTTKTSSLANGSLTRGLRSAPPSAPSTSPFHSPGVSPGRKGNTNTASRPNGNSKTSPTRNGLCGMPSRVVSPNETYSVPLSRPTRSRAPNPSSRYSPRAVSPSPSAVHSPSSPRIGNLRPKNINRADMRRNVIHVLALGEQSVHAVKSRIIGSGAPESQHTMIMGVLHEVSEAKHGMFKLREKCWKEVDDTFSTYTDMERTRMKSARAEAIGDQDGKYESDEKGKLPSYIENADKLEEALEAFERNNVSKSPVIRIRSEQDETYVRKEFKTLHPIYIAGIEWIEDVAAMIRSLEKRWMDTKSDSERQMLAKRIIEKHSIYKTRHAKFVRIVPIMHERVRKMKKEIDEWTQSRSR